MQAVYLEKKGLIQVRDFSSIEIMGPTDVLIAVKVVGICGSDIHYYKEGSIGSFVVNEPMVLGHEASGVVLKVGSQVQHLQVGDKVCMEPGIPNWMSKESKQGLYNLDPSVRFWATPPIHGCLRESVVHPAALTYRLPSHVALEEGALVEPLAIGIHAAETACIKPGDIALVLGSGTIGLVTALAALAGGCSTVVVTDIVAEKLTVAGKYKNIVTVDTNVQDIALVVRNLTDSQGVDIVFDACGSPRAIDGAIGCLKAAGTMVLIGMPAKPIPFDVVQLQIKEITIKTIFRYANNFEQALRLIASGAIDVKPLISKIFTFSQSLEAFELAAKQNSDIVKVLIALE